MSTFVTHAVQAWSGVYSESAVLRTLVAFLHIGGLVGGGGAAIVADRATLLATRRGAVVGREQLARIHGTHRIVVAGLAAVIVSGILLFAADADTYLVSRLFWLKMGMVAALMLNGALLVRVGAVQGDVDARTARTLRWTTLVSVTLWFLTTLAGAGLPNI